MKLHELSYTDGSKKTKKRVGRGTSSGSGKTSGRGQKGQKARSGGGTRLGFEGGQTPLFRRIPKFGFKNINKKEYTILNLDDLNQLEFSEINNETLLKNKVIKKKNSLVKVLSNGKIEKKITLKVDKVSKNAKKAIIEAGGKVEEIYNAIKDEKK